ncbi:hypothetical protein BKA63DRAFT_201593 [Paraphoma chrysanthemicola]|nr:hypothetical protein BKA63DRAFT_201593 [Paraphoma chrysanthemicola]
MALLKALALLSILQKPNCYSRRSRCIPAQAQLQCPQSVQLLIGSGQVSVSSLGAAFVATTWQKSLTERLSSMVVPIVRITFAS